MRKIDETKITSDKSMFFKQGTWTHLQKSYKEITEETIKSLIGSAYDTSKVYVLNGCVNSGSGSNFIISAGSVFYNGEIYLIDSATFTVSGANVAVGTITVTNNTTDYNADPCLFTDGTYENVHNIRKFVIAGGASGSGTVNYSLFVFYPFANNYKDISSTITLGSGFSVSQKIILKYLDGTIYVVCEFGYSTNKIIGSTVLSGLPNNGTNFKDVRGFSTDSSVDTNVNMKLTVGGNLVLRDALTGGASKLLIVEFSYKLI
jgi:hypothetical protein